jgi:hypothetical protein
MRLGGAKRQSLPALVAIALAIAATPALAYVPGNRWTTTASGSTGSEGDAATITWSLVRDGLSIPSEGASNLIDFMDDIFNVTSGGTNFSSRPWFGLFQESFDRWSALSSINFVYEPNDSGTYTSAGSLGVRGDIRIGGQNIDGSGSTLAYAQFPNNGNIVMDTSETSFYSNSSNNYRAFRNTLMHEIGHAFGLDHLESSSDSLLMEPVINTSFDGPQLDDIRGVQDFYGDAFEKSNAGQGNGSHSLATNLGSVPFAGLRSVGAHAVGSQAVSSTETDFVSIADTGDVDFYSFTVSGPALLDLTLNPLGGTFTQGVQGGQQSSFNASARNDLSVAVFSTNGTTLLASASSAPIGQAELLGDVNLTTAGQYFVRIMGDNDSVQLYELQLSATAAVTPLAGDYNDDGVVDAADYVVWRKTEGTPGDYAVWQNHFGETQSGAGGVSSLGVGVPEPHGVVLLFVAITYFVPLRGPRRGT